MPVLPITNTEAEQRTDSKQYLGSFWNESFPEKTQVLALATLCRQTALVGDFKSIFYNLAGNHEFARRKTFITVPFKTNQIIRSGMQYFDDPRVTAEFGFDQSNSAFSFSFYRLPYNALYMQHVTPTLIQAFGRNLALGIDFFLENDFVFFREDPTVLFPQGYYTVLVGIDTGYQTLMAPLLGVNVPEYEDLIIQYVKKYQTPGWFRVAAAAAAGMGILRYAQQLLDIQTTQYGTIYIFEKETLRVDYTHTPLVVGTKYPQYYIIGDGLQIVYGDGSGVAWWRQIDWAGGISLDPLIPTFKGLQLLDQETFAFAAGSDPGSVAGSKLHTRVDLNNADWQLESAYWAQVATLETDYGFYLNNVIGLSDAVDSGNPHLQDTFAKLETAAAAANVFNTEMGWPLQKPDYEALPDKLSVNALDVFFEAILSAVSMVVRIDPTRIGDPERLYAFLKAQMTPGAVPVIVALPPALAGDVLSSGILGDGPVVFFSYDCLIVTDSVHISSIITDSVVFIPEVPIINLN